MSVVSSYIAPDRRAGEVRTVSHAVVKKDAYALLATDGMLVKRPVLVVRGGADGDTAVFSFREPAWAQALGIDIEG